MAAQKCYYDPSKPFERRLFNESWQKDNLEKKQNFQKDPKAGEKIQDQFNPGAKKGGGDVVEFTLKRVMKNLNNYILNEYQKLFQLATTDSKSGITQKEFISNAILLKKAGEELRFCEDKNISSVDLIKKCLAELETQGFLNTLEGEADEYLYQIRDQRDKLKVYISEELQQNKTGKGMNFDQIYRKVAQQFQNFYTKDFVFKVIDELFQMGAIYEVSRCTYAYLDNKF